jgi:DNA-binding response OmpR family regulator
MALRIMVVEDKPELATCMMRAIEALGHTLHGLARNGSEVADLLSKGDPDVVTIDMDLGGRQDGMGLAVVLEAAGAIPVVFVTSNDAEVTEIEESRTIEGSSRLFRPFNADDLAHAIDKAKARVARSQAVDG